MNKDEIQKSFYTMLEKFWKENPKPDVFYVQSYLWDWVEDLLDKQKKEIKEMMANTPYMSPRALEDLIIQIDKLNK